MIDLIRDGVPAAELKREGDKAVWRALFRTACSASQRGWDCWEWESQVLEAPNQLGLQLRSKNAIRPRTAEQVQKLLDSAWDKATAWLSTRPAAFGTQEAQARAEAAAEAAQAVLANPSLPLSHVQRVVLEFAVQEALRLRVTRIALSRRHVVEQTGLGERSVRNALDALEQRGFLDLAERGRPGTIRKRANLYRLGVAALLAAAHPVPVNGPVGPPDQICGTPPVTRVGTPLAPARSVGPLVKNGKEKREEQEMVSFTVTAPNAEELARALALLRGEPDLNLQVEVPDPVEQLPDNVKPLQPHKRAT